MYWDAGDCVSSVVLKLPKTDIENTKYWITYTGDVTIYLGNEINTEMQKSKNSDKDNYDLKNETYIVGHRPVQMFGTTEMISIKGKIFDIDGGCALLDKYDNNLILLCLDTMEEEYIN